MNARWRVGEDLLPAVTWINFLTNNEYAPYRRKQTGNTQNSIRSYQTAQYEEIIAPTMNTKVNWDSMMLKTKEIEY